MKNKVGTHKVVTRIRGPPEHVTPVQEYRRGKHGSPFQSNGGFLNPAFSLSKAITAEQDYTSINLEKKKNDIEKW